MKVIIRAVRSRTAFVEEMLKGLPKDTIVFYDDIYHDAMLSYLHALRMCENKACLLLEDDVELTSNFMAKVYNAIRGHEHDVINFFSMRKDDAILGSRYDYTFTSNCCSFFPDGITDAIVKYFNYWTTTEVGKVEVNATDYLVRDFLRQNKMRYWLHVPSLVQHLEARSVINPRRSSKRQSKTFVK